MKEIQLGKTELYAPPIVFGGNVFGWTVNEKESFELIQARQDSHCPEYST